MFRVIFYKNENGVEFVRDWLKYELPMADRKIIGENLATLQEGFPMIWNAAGQADGRRHF